MICYNDYNDYKVTIWSFWIIYNSAMDSNLVEVKQVDQNNKGLFSNAKFVPWSSVLQCEPICATISLSFRNRYCSYCFLEREVERCAACKVTYYCSKDCQRQDWRVHKMQCGALKLLASKNLEPSKINMELQLNLRLWLLRRKDQTVDQQTSQMCSLIEFQPPQKLSQFQQAAVMLCNMLQLERNEQNMRDLIKQQCTVSLNCFTIQDYLCNEESVGLGLYWPANFINHHCHPNCTQIFDGRTLKIVANRPINEKEEITVSYMPVLDSWASKRKVCREGYLFECFCEQCQVNRMFDQNVMHIKCASCHENKIHGKKKNGQQKEQNEQGKQSEQSEYECRNCKKIITAEDLNMVIEKANKFISIISVQSSSYEEMKKALLDLRKLISMTDPRMSACIHKVYIESLNQSADRTRELHESYILLKEMLGHFRSWYRLNPEDEIPYVYVWRYAEAGKLAYLLEKLKKACEYTEKAQIIVDKIKFKNKFVEVKELKQRSQQIKIGLSFNKAELFKRS